jgi:hypothetical protein
LIVLATIGVVLKKAHAYAHERRKKCNLPPSLSDEEIANRLHQVYNRLFGEELMNALAQIHAQDPDQAMAIIKEVFGKQPLNTME